MSLRACPAIWLARENVQEIAGQARNDVSQARNDVSRARNDVSQARNDVQENPRALILPLFLLNLNREQQIKLQIFHFAVLNKIVEVQRFFKALSRLRFL